MAIGTDPSDRESLDALIRDIENLNFEDIDPDALREAEVDMAQFVLDELVGKTIKAAVHEENRIVLETADGNRYFFYAFMGSGRPSA
jgi:hypothetical protein